MPSLVQYYRHKRPFALEGGMILNEMTIAYHTFGRLNEDGDNVVWVCHALTANSNAEEWWTGLIGPGKVIDTEKYFVVCDNILGSCYGTEAALFDGDEPTLVTIRDMVGVHRLLREHLGIGQIRLLMGGSMGGYQVLEWAIQEPDVVRELFLIGTAASESAWGIAIHSAQRLAIEADPTWKEGGEKGLMAARGIGMLTYRTYQQFVSAQTGPQEVLQGFRAESYIRYQAEKLARRFDARNYWLLTRSMDSHHIARGRGMSIEAALQGIKQRTLVIGIDSDLLCPFVEQKFLAQHLPHARLIGIDSIYGHDGFLTESAKIGGYLREWLEGS
ncbi:homoserine O-acetyltransferase family protein [Dinghuibacter silviterrae]|uniref:Homoserine O-acetyltransferase n=1 Tax=Dinghuibacter silviterrae TaxID=1539049 RepID=A0A4R8DSK8_9BACT|nr:homoserine O-acetyltransferase [Dinghuibacter silviterrae]TDX00395.1 homoserine O-acetyltransferase [Dinghuibacter silviterrae]